MSEWPGGFEVKLKEARKKPHYKARRIMNSNICYNKFERGRFESDKYFWYTSNGNCYEYTTK